MSTPLNVFEASMTGVSLVEASAGTGKTYNITSLYVRAILEKGLSPAQILVMTYTEAATAELKFRLRNRLKESLVAVQSGNSSSDPFLEDLIAQNYHEAPKKLQSAIDTFDEASVFTIHGFCRRILTEYSLQFGVAPDFDLLTDESELLQDCVDSYWRFFIKEADKDEQKLILLDYLTDEGFGPDELKEVLLEVLRHSNSKLVPEGISLSRLFGLIPDLETAFNELKRVWEKEGPEITQLYHSGNLNGQSFRKGASKEKDWQNLLNLLKSSIPKISIDERMSRFGNYMQEKGSTAKFTVPEYDFFKAIEAYLSISERLKLLKPAFIKESVQSIKSHFEEEKEASNLLSYNDLLEVVENKLTNDNDNLLSKKISDTYPLALIDEFQDTDFTQYSIFKKIYGKRDEKAFFMIGDPKQAIYGFRGADIFTYLDAKKDATESQSYSLSENYRSNQEMINGINELYSISNSPFLIDGLNFNPAQFPSRKEDNQYIRQQNGDSITPLQFIKVNNEESSSKNKFKHELYESVCDEIMELLSGNYFIGSRRVMEKDIAILIRKGFQGEELQSLLRQKGLKSVLKSRTSVFETLEAEELFLIFKSIQKISYEPGIRAALATELLGFQANDIAELLDDEVKWTGIIDDLIEVKEIWVAKGIEPAIEKLLYQFEVRERLAAKNGAERRITNLMHLSELLGKAQQELKIEGKALLKWFYQKRGESGSDSEDEMLRLESDEDLIQISTIHGSKGLQYPIVMCPFLWDSGSSKTKNDFLKFNKEGENYIDISSGVHHPKRDEYEQIAIEQEKAEEVRLTYVALTRSVAACYVFLPDYNKIQDSPLASIVTGSNMVKKGTYSALVNELSDCDSLEVRDKVDQKSEGISPKEKSPKDTLKSANFKRTDIFHYPRMLSYSSLAEGKEHDETGHDYDELFEPVKEEADELNKFGFPKGAAAGTFLHKVFEDIQFDNPHNLEQVISANLDFYGFDDLWLKPVKKWVSDILKHNLGIPSNSLSDLKQANVLKEMEFFFPVKDIEVQDLWSLVREKKTGRADLDKLRGFMKGFIDLIFKAGDKYFILDYKSNYLGAESANYDLPNLTQAMLDSGYDLQYHIYTLALHRFLKLRIQDYKYDEHFGGVLYLFLRGVDNSEPGSGVFYHKPSKEMISNLDQYFSEGILK